MFIYEVSIESVFGAGSLGCGCTVSGKEPDQAQSKMSLLTPHTTSEAWSCLWYLEPHLLQACHRFVKSAKSVSSATEDSTLSTGRRLGRWSERREELPTGALPPACLIPISLCTRGVSASERQEQSQCGRHVEGRR